MSPHHITPWKLQHYHQSCGFAKCFHVISCQRCGFYETNLMFWQRFLIHWLYASALLASAHLEKGLLHCLLQGWENLGNEEDQKKRHLYIKWHHFEYRLQFYSQSLLSCVLWNRSCPWIIIMMMITITAVIAALHDYNSTAMIVA